jgi:hypothetical protein
MVHVVEKAKEINDRRRNILTSHAENGSLSHISAKKRIHYTTVDE